MSYQRLLALATLCVVGAFLTIVLRVAHPHHRKLALIIYGIGWVPFLFSIHKLWITLVSSTGHLLRWKIHILVGIAFLLFSWAFNVPIPVEKSPLLKADLEQFPAILEVDQQQLAFIDSKMQAALMELQESPLVEADQLSTDNMEPQLLDTLAAAQAELGRFDEAISNSTEPLPIEDTFEGAGIYTIYYTGDFPLYGRIADQNRKDRFDRPIYVGRAVPKGRRSGVRPPTVGRIIHGRLSEHGGSIEQTQNLEVKDFVCLSVFGCR